jgi:hypothetical protein
VFLAVEEYLMSICAACGRDAELAGHRLCDDCARAAGSFLVAGHPSVPWTEQIVACLKDSIGIRDLTDDSRSVDTLLNLAEMFAEMGLKNEAAGHAGLALSYCEHDDMRIGQALDSLALALGTAKVEELVAAMRDDPHR